MTTADSGPAGRDAAALERVRALVTRWRGDRPVVVYLFGSWASGRPHRASDIDIAIEAWLLAMQERLPPVEP
jgi:predicted nucleotidyltransferase